MTREEVSRMLPGCNATQIEDMHMFGNYLHAEMMHHPIMHNGVLKILLNTKMFGPEIYYWDSNCWLPSLTTTLDLFTPCGPDDVPTVHDITD